MNLTPSARKREDARHYIPMSASDEKSMLESLSLKNLDDLYAHIPQSLRMKSIPLPPEISADELRARMSETAAKNTKFCATFLGDSLPQWKVEPIVAEVSAVRGLSTAYTPYQPERSQGTLISHWIYECAMSSLLGFEAVNCSLYDRATALFEACAAVSRMERKNTVILSGSLLPQDVEVVRTLAAHTQLKLIDVSVDPDTGASDAESIENIIAENPDVAAVVFPQVSNVGTLEDVDALADLCARLKVRSVAVVDPFLLGAGGLKEPSAFGERGADIVVGEGQHLCSAPSFGGPGLGVFAVRYSDERRNDIRQAPGRFVGKAQDIEGRQAFTMILSTREQHIRREKATSNICSNQAFIATLAGAALLQKGDAGMRASLEKARASAQRAFKKIAVLGGYECPFKDVPFFNEICVVPPVPVSEIIKAASERGLQIGADVSGRARKNNILKISFTDLQSDSDVDWLITFLAEFGQSEAVFAAVPAEIPARLLRKNDPEIPSFDFGVLRDYYKRLGDANVSPDDTCYPLGSCTMKYNPFVNDELADISGFQNCHPQALPEDSQGCLEILWKFSEAVKAVTNLDAVALQPVAGAQGELCALKMFQAYHADFSENPRDIVLIPSSAHGTNFASAAMAGYKPENIVQIPASSDGTLSIDAFGDILQKYGERVAAVMITNPNTSGIFECEFKKIASAVHMFGGLVFMDGANFNAIAGRIDLKAMGVDAVHNNIHKTWSVSHGGGGPGDGFVAVDAKLADYIPAYCVRECNGGYEMFRPRRSIGSLHRNFGNFAHKVRALAYIMRLGGDGVRHMSGAAVLSARYLFNRLSKTWETLPRGAENTRRMHEFILTPSEADFQSLDGEGVAKQGALARIGKLFLDYGYHAPTVAFPEIFGLMIEPSESYDKAELDRFAETVEAVHDVVRNHPWAAELAPRFTPVGRIDEVEANRRPVLSEKIKSLPKIPDGGVSAKEINALTVSEITKKILADKPKKRF